MVRNIEERKAQHKKSYLRHKEKHKQRYWENPEKYRKYYREKYWENREQNQRRYKGWKNVIVNQKTFAYLKKIKDKNNFRNMRKTIVFIIKENIKLNKRNEFLKKHYISLREKYKVLKNG